MRVVFVTHNYPRAPGDLPGAFLHPLALALRARGHDVRVVAPSHRGAGGRDEVDGVPVNRVRYAAPEREWLGYEGRLAEAGRSAGGLRALAGLIAALRREARSEVHGSRGGAVLHAHWWVPAGLALPAGVPSVITVHGTDGRLLSRGVLPRLAGRWALRRVRVVTAVSRSLGEEVARATGRTDVLGRIHSMPVPLDGRPWSGGAGDLVTVARLTAQKRLHLALEALAHLRELGTPLRLTIIGDGPERASLARIAGELHLTSQVEFTGALASAEVALRLARARAFILPAAGEGFGLAVVEALMAGVPAVVCQDGGGAAEVVERWGGGLIVPPDRVAIAEAIRGIDSAREAARQAGQRWRAELAPDRVAAIFERWYSEALGA